MTQGKAAALVNVSRATFAQWETARHLPAEERVHDLDRLLKAGGELIAVAEQVRPGHRLRPVDGGHVRPAHTRSLRNAFSEIRRALLEQLHTDSKGRIGWRHHLVSSEEPPSVLSTAYGLKVLAMLGGPDARTPAVVRSVLDRAVRDGGRIVGWQAKAQSAPRMETTGTAIDALLRAGVTIEVDNILHMLGKLVDKSARARPFVLTTGLEPLLRVAPDSGLAADLVRELLACRIEVDGVRLWPEKLVEDREQPNLKPSLAHTARAVTVLRDAPDGLIGDAVTAAAEWVAEQDDLSEVSETIRRDLTDDKREEITFRHFTSAWVIRALAGAVTPDRRRIASAREFVWSRYDAERHFWTLANGDAPVWMLADAVAGLLDAALALSETPIPAPFDPG